MKSKVNTCYDYKLLAVDEKNTKWHVQDSEIQQELERLAADYSKEEHITEEIQDGDSVMLLCRKSDEESWVGRNILVFPGKELPYASQIEKDVVGKKKGDEICSVIGNNQGEFEISDVIRRQRVEIGDELIIMLGIEQIDTVEKYYTWYRKQKEEERKYKAEIAISHDWLVGIAEKSDIYIDKEEERSWGELRAKLVMDSMKAAGYDITKTPEGKELTEEEAFEMCVENQIQYFIPFVIYCYFCEQDGYVLTEKDYLEEMEKLAKQHNMDLETALAQSDIVLYREKMYQEHTYNILCSKAKEFLEV